MNDTVHDAMLSKLPAYTKCLMNGNNNNYYYYLLDMIITTIISKTVTMKVTFLMIPFTSDWHFPLFQSL